eukprot:4137102-Prymnesium_polylepis.1
MASFRHLQVRRPGTAGADRITLSLGVYPAGGRYSARRGGARPRGRPMGMAVGRGMWGMADCQKLEGDRFTAPGAA